MDRNGIMVSGSSKQGIIGGEAASRSGRGGDCGGSGLEREDSPGLDVRACLEGMALRGGRRCLGEGGGGGGGGRGKDPLLYYTYGKED